METLEFNPNMITPEDQDAMAMAAFIGRLDDIVLAESTIDYNQTNATNGGAISERVLGLFDTASTFHSENMVKNLELVRVLANRLEEIAMIEGCRGHNHAQEMLDTINETYGLRQSDEHNHGDSLRTRDHENDEYETDPKTGKKNKKKKRAGWFSLIVK